MSKKLKKLEIQKILQEYSFLRIDDEYKKTLKEEHISDFLEQAGIHKEDDKTESEPKPTEFKISPSGVATVFTSSSVMFWLASAGISNIRACLISSIAFESSPLNNLEAQSGTLEALKSVV